MLNTLQQAIYQLINADSTLSGLVTGVHDRPPQQTGYPYITIGQADSSDWSTSTSTGQECRFTVDIWSREGGRKQMDTIIQRLYEILHDGTLTLSGYTLVSMRMMSSQSELGQDGWTYHGSVKFRALIETT